MQQVPQWLKNAYKSTEIYWGKSQAQIHQMLGSLGIEQIRFTNMPDRFVLEFVIKLEERAIPRAVRIVIPLTSTPQDKPEKRNKELNTIHRVLYNRLKSKFINIYSGIVEFEQEFMAELIIKDRNGNSTTMGEMILPQYRKGLDDGTNPEFKLLN